MNSKICFMFREYNMFLRAELGFMASGQVSIWLEGYGFLMPYKDMFYLLLG